MKRRRAKGGAAIGLGAVLSIAGGLAVGKVGSSFLLALDTAPARADPVTECWTAQRSCEARCERMWAHCWQIDDWPDLTICLCGPRQQGTWCRFIAISSGVTVFELRCIEKLPERCKDFDRDKDGDVDLLDIGIRLGGVRPERF